MTISSSPVTRNAAEAALPLKVPPKSSLWKLSIRRLLKNKLAVGGFIVVLLMFVACFIGPLFSPYTDNKINMTAMKQGPGIHHWLGTDALGRDVLTRVLMAGRISLTVGLASMVLSVFIGSLLGAIAGYYRGMVDQVIMRIADLLLTIPGLPLLFIFGALLSDWKVPPDSRMYIVMLMLSFVKLARYGPNGTGTDVKLARA